MDDPEKFNSASLDEIRKPFCAWIEEKGGKKADLAPRYRVCLVVDDEVIASFRRAPDDDDDDSELDGRDEITEDELWGCYVKAAEAYPDWSNARYEYQGWMRCSVFVLLDLWECMGDGADMGALLPDPDQNCVIPFIHVLRSRTTSVPCCVDENSSGRTQRLWSIKRLYTCVHVHVCPCKMIWNQFKTPYLIFESEAVRCSYFL